MSLVEVMMSFVLVGILVLLVSGAVTSSYKTAAAMQKLPGLYYKGQQGIENDLDDLEKRVTKKYLYEKELSSVAHPDPSIADSLEEINDGLREECEKLDFTLFGKDVTLYQFTREYEIEKVGNIVLHAGTASGVKLERPVPVLDTVTINAVGGSVSPECFNSVGKTLTTTVTYAETNKEYHYTELYQWYVSTGKQHAVYYADGTPGPDEMLHGTVMPVYPADFTLISSERTSSMVITEEYRGKFVFCLVTPLSVNGKMGESVVSNLVYISDLPGGLIYRAVIDPSLIVVPYGENGKAPISMLDSTSAANGTFTVNGGSPYIDLVGAMVSETSGAITRFLHFDTTDTVKSAAGLNVKDSDVIFVVARNNASSKVNFILAGSDKYGFGRNSSATEPTGDGWVLLKIKVGNNATAYQIGGADVDIAELIISQSPGTAGEELIGKYLKNKYGIS